MVGPIARIDMIKSGSSCPGGLEHVTSPKLSCRKNISVGCSQVYFSSHGMSYSKVCGRVIGYQHGSPDAFSPAIYARNIDDMYVDDLLLPIIIQGNIFGHLQHNQMAIIKITLMDAPALPIIEAKFPTLLRMITFVKLEPNETYSNRYFTEHKLWDGNGCGTFPNGFAGTRSSFFIKQLPNSISLDVQLRVCMDEGRDNEDIIIEKLSLLVQ